MTEDPPDTWPTVTVDSQWHHRTCLKSMTQKRWKQWCRDFAWLRGKPQLAKCAFCRDFACESPKRSQLTQHEKSKLHLARGSSCPSTNDFEKMISERMSGTSLRKSSLGSFKTLKMLWCANEAVKDLIKKRIKHMITASISQDGQGATVGVRMCIVSLDHGGYSVEIQSVSALKNRKSKQSHLVLLCFHATVRKWKYENMKSIRSESPCAVFMPSVMALVFQGQDGLIATSSILSFLKRELSGSHNLSKASFTAVKRFFTARRHPVRGWSGESPKLDRASMKKFADAIETWKSLDDQTLIQWDRSIIWKQMMVQMMNRKSTHQSQSSNMRKVWLTYLIVTINSDSQARKNDTLSMSLSRSSLGQTQLPTNSRRWDCRSSCSLETFAFQFATVLMLPEGLTQCWLVTGHLTN